MIPRNMVISHDLPHRKRRSEMGFTNNTWGFHSFTWFHHEDCGIFHGRFNRISNFKGCPEGGFLPISYLIPKGKHGKTTLKFMFIIWGGGTYSGKGFITFRPLSAQKMSGHLYPPISPQFHRPFANSRKLVQIADKTLWWSGHFCKKRSSFLKTLLRRWLAGVREFGCVCLKMWYTTTWAYDLPQGGTP